jgi:hypothetical protein
MRTRAVEALMISDAVLCAPPVVRDWLLALLLRGEEGRIEASEGRRIEASEGRRIEAFGRRNRGLDPRH